MLNIILFGAPGAGKASDNFFNFLTPKKKKQNQTDIRLNFPRAKRAITSSTS